MRYAVYQSGYSIFGVGDTPEAAIEAARQELGPYGELRNVRRAGRTAFPGAFYVAPCTDRLAKAVARDGGDLRYHVHDGVVDLDD